MIVIPVTLDGYLCVLAGDYMTYDVPLKQTRVPSTHLLLEAVMERPRELGAEAILIKNLTWTRYAANVSQAGLFSHRLSPSTTNAIRILSFGGSPINEKRLKAFGIRPTGGRMPQARLEHLEMRITLARPLSQDTC